MKVVFTITILICMMLIASIAWSRIIHVPADQPTIQAGIDVAVDGDTVLVADGTYIGDGNKNLNFKGKAITVESENGADNCIIDCENDGRGFHFKSNEGENSVVSGFTITNGYDSWGGGGIFCSSFPTIINCNISANTTGRYGGGIFCEFSSPIITNCTITGNTAVGGGGIYYLSSSPTITNCTITGNMAKAGGGIYCDSSSLSITNCILWDDLPDEIDVYGGDPIVTYSDIQGGWEGEGNIDADPMFVDPDNGDYHLQADSPCIDAGTLTGAPPDDIEGNPRDEFPDMGAYEYQKVVTGSINGRVTDMADNPIKWAFVIAVDADTKDKYKAFTDRNGDYEIPDLPPGTYWVICIKKDYKAGIRKAEVVAGEETTVDFRLRLKPD